MSTKFVFCEGKDDAAVIEELAAFLKLPDIRVEDFRGRDKLGDFLRAAWLRPEFVTRQIESVGIVLDADHRADSAWHRLRDTVRTSVDVELTAPGVFADDRPRIAGWVMPGEGQPGMLETVCLESVKDRPEYICVEEFAQCVQQRTKRILHPKARYRAWAAAQDDFARPLEREARSPGFPWAHPAFSGLRQFLRSL